MFDRLLVANRGEIARRIIAVAKRLGISTVAVYSDADAGAPFVREADTAVRIGGPPAKESYLNIPAVLAAARQTGARAVHPGYGFLSESSGFARACEEAGLVFVGPPGDVMDRMKDKSEARRVVASAGVPVVPGSDGVVGDLDVAAETAERIGYPVLVKAAAGGGGIGMAVARDRKELERAFRQCTDRAIAAFARGGVYLERYFEAPRHLEVQILGDGAATLHVLERECSIQRRHQKVVEEAGAPLFAEGQHPALREELLAKGVAAARAFGYVNAGTVEFLFADGHIYFIEMNARLQVEHPVTEVTTGVDLIGWQLRIAAGERLSLRQEQIVREGAAIELRVYAEDPVRFLPSPGKLTVYRPPVGEALRVDSGYAEGDTVTPYYDPLIAKLIAWGDTRERAIDRAADAVRRFELSGLKSNLPLHQRILDDPAFREGRLSTRFLEQHAKPNP